MKSPSLKAVTEVTSLAPQFLVNDLSEAIGYYRDRLGFEPDFVYESFYASVSRDGFSIHLKCAPKTRCGSYSPQTERAPRRLCRGSRNRGAIR